MAFGGISGLFSRLKDLFSSREKTMRLGVARQVASGHTQEKVAERVTGAYETVVKKSEH